MGASGADHRADGLQQYARSLAGQIERRMEELSDELLAAGPAPDDLRRAERLLLSEFEGALTLALADYRPPMPGRSGISRLAFQPQYDEVLSKMSHYSESKPSRAAFLPSVLAALAMAEVEALGPLRLPRNLTEQLAGILTRLGEALEHLDMLTYAAEAYDRAARLHLENDDHAARDRCLRLQAAALHHALPPGRKRFVQTLNGAFFGYGFAPYRVLFWMVAQIVVASVILVLLPRHGDATFGGTLYLALQDYVNPMGLGDTQGLPGVASGVLVVESYFGLMSSSVFFALLLRKWFRV